MRQAPARAMLLRGGNEERRRSLCRFFERRSVNALIALLILVSVTLTLAQLASPGAESDLLVRVEIANYVLTWIFAVELTVRLYAEWDVGLGSGANIWSFWKRWWVDLIAVVPFLYPAFKGGGGLLRSLRAARWMRILRLGRVFSGTSRFLPHAIRGEAVHLALVVFAAFSTVAVGTAMILSFERLASQPAGGFAGAPTIDGFDDAFWFSLYSLFAGEPIPGVPATVEGRITSIVVLIMGVLVVAFLTAAVTALLVDRLRRERLGLGRGDLLENHIVVCGLDQVGFRVTEALSQVAGDTDVFVIDPNESNPLLNELRRRSIPFAVDDPRRSEVLEAAGVARAMAVIACTDDDLVNFEVALEARHLHAAARGREAQALRVVLRLFDEELASRLAFGFDMRAALSTPKLAAPALAAAALDESVLGSLYVTGRVFVPARFTVATGTTVGTVRRDFGVHTIMIQVPDAEAQWAPGEGEEIPAAGDVVVLGPLPAVAELRQAIGADGERSHPENGHVIVVGLGQVGLKVVEALLHLEQSIVVVDKDPVNEFIGRGVGGSSTGGGERRVLRASDGHAGFAERHPGDVAVICGDARIQAVLAAAGLEAARAVIPCTGNDLVNLEVALDVRQARPDLPVILRLFNEQLAARISGGFDIQTTLSSSALAAPALAAAAFDRSVKGSIDLQGVAAPNRVREKRGRWRRSQDRSGGQHDLYVHSSLHISPTSELAGVVTVADLLATYHVHVLALELDGEAKAGHRAPVWAPESSTIVAAGARIEVVGPPTLLRRLKRDAGAGEEVGAR